jgi:CRP/FNR family cyclic AMP-dependent transcriptional regulator
MLNSSMYLQWVGQPVSDRFAGYVKSEGMKVAFRKGAIILNEGDISQHLYYLDKGWVAFYLNNPNGESRIVSLGTPRRAFGIGPALDQIPVTFCAKAIEDCEIYMVTQKELIEKMKEDINLSMEVMCIVNARARSLTESANLFSTLLTPGEKLINYFLSLIEFMDYIEPRDWYELPINLSHTQIGQIIGVSRITVCRLFNKYKVEGKIKICGQKQFIHHDLIKFL